MMNQKHMPRITITKSYITNRGPPRGYTSTINHIPRVPGSSFGLVLPAGMHLDSSGDDPENHIVRKLPHTCYRRNVDLLSSSSHPFCSSPKDSLWTPNCASSDPKAL